MTISAIGELNAKSITTFDRATNDAIAEMLKAAHVRLAQTDRAPKDRTFTARNYDSAIKALGKYMAETGAILPTKSTLESWRDGSINGSTEPDGKPKSVRTANARLAAARKLLIEKNELLREERRAIAEARLTKQYRDADKNSDRKYAIAAQRELNKLFGLDVAPEPRTLNVAFQGVDSDVLSALIEMIANFGDNPNIVFQELLEEFKRAATNKREKAD
mgnify:CR=1 FL=1